MLKSASHVCFQPFAGLREREIVILVYAVVYNLKSGNYLTYFEQLKHGLQRYQSRHQQTTKQTKSHCTIKKESKYF